MRNRPKETNSSAIRLSGAFANLPAKYFFLDYEDVQPAKSKTYSAPVNLSARQIQKALKSAGFYQGAVDGKIGSKTKSAIIKFQKAHSLKADGVVGKRTSMELNKYLSE